MAFPVLSVIAASDPLLPDVEAMAAVVPDHRMVVVQDYDHFTLTSAAACREAIEAFIAGTSGAVEAQPPMS
jgi:hypothetical protein